MVVRHYTFVDYATQTYVVLVAVLILILHDETVPYWAWLIGAHASCLILVHVLIRLHCRGHPSNLLDILRHFYPLLLYLFFFAETGWLNRMIFKEYMDPIAIHWDQALFGYQPSIVLMQKFPYPTLSELFYAAYFSYYLMIAGVGLALFLRNRGQFFHYVSVVSFVFYICYIIYIILPIIGPRVFLEPVGGYILPEASRLLAPNAFYPDTVQRGIFFKLMAFIYRVFEAPGSAIPSSHVAIAVCTLVFSFFYLRRIRYLHLAMVILLCLATIYCRYHYVVDVMAGLTAAAILVPLGNRLYHSVGGDLLARRQEPFRPQASS